MISNFWYAVAMLTGTIVGVGVFGLPYVAWHAGFFVEAVYLGALFLVFVSLHLMFGEIILRTGARHRLVGYVGLYLGERARKIVTLTTILGTLGGMLVYILVGGKFLNVLFNGFLSVPVYSYLVFWTVGSVLIIFGLKIIKRSELIMLFFMIAAIAVLVLGGIKKISPDNFFTFDSSRIFLPYGITLFALAGIAAVPAVRDILEGSEKKMKGALILGTALPALFYVLFAALVLGVSGVAVSEDAISGLKDVLGGSVVFTGALFGVFTVATSYITFGLYLKDMLVYDLNVSKILAFSFIILAPIALVFLRSDSFIVVLGFLGAIFGGLESIFLIYTYKKARQKGDRTPEYNFNIPTPLLNLLIAVFALGIFYALFFDGKI